MDLFNKYKNKDFAFLINYINTVLSSGKSLSTYKILQFFNKTKSFYETKKYVIKNNNCVFYKNEKNHLIPVYNNPVIARLTKSERAWLYNILHDPKALLFLDKDAINMLITDLENTNNLPYILSNNELHIQKLNDAKPHIYTIEEKGVFNKIISAIENKKYITITTKKKDTLDKNIIENAVAYKIEYRQEDDSLHFIYFNIEEKTLHTIPVLMIHTVKINGNIKNYKKTEQDIKNALEYMRQKNPVIIEIENKDNAFQRAAYKFILYDRIIYEKDNKIFMEIYYSEPQKDEIVSSILQLGKYIKVISPANICSEIKDEILARNNNFI